MADSADESVGPGPVGHSSEPLADANDVQLRIPYEDIKFTDLRGNGMLFFDFTAFIPALLLYEAKNMLFTRPSRFGKSLFLDTFATYVDQNTSEKDFRAAFGGTAVFPDGSKPLPVDARSYCVLRLGLGLDVSNSHPVMLQEQLGRVILRACRKLMRRYKLTVPDVLLSSSSPKDALDVLEGVVNAVIESGRRLFILIDEYDLFANELMLKDPAVYSRLVADGKASKTLSPISGLYVLLKKIAQETELDAFRTFSVGITPIALADASGPRSIVDLTRKEQFADVLGVREETVARALDALILSDSHRGLVLDRMREYYSGFRFYGGRTPLYHPRLCTFFFKRLLSSTSFVDVMTSPATGVETLLGLMDCPDVGLSEYSISFMLGQPQFRNALLLGGMLELPTERGVMSLGARREVTMSIGAFQQKLLFANVLSTSSASSFGSPQDRVRLYLYFHGVLAYVRTMWCPTTNEMRVVLRVPNLTAIARFSGELQSLREERIGDIIRTVCYPSEFEVQRLISSLIQHPGGLANERSWDEVCFQASISSYILGAAKNTAQDLSVRSEMPTSVIVNSGREQVVSSTDIVVESCGGTVALLMELKVIHRSSVRERKASGLPFSTIHSYLSNKAEPGFVLSDDILLSLGLKTGFILRDAENNLARISTNKDPVIVGDLQELALSQAQRHRRNLRTKYDSLRCFSVVMVGYAVLVRELLDDE